MTLEHIDEVCKDQTVDIDKIATPSNQIGSAQPESQSYTSPGDSTDAAHELTKTRPIHRGRIRRTQSPSIEP